MKIVIEATPNCLFITTDNNTLRLGLTEADTFGKLVQIAIARGTSSIGRNTTVSMDAIETITAEIPRQEFLDSLRRAWQYEEAQKFSIYNDTGMTATEAAAALRNLDIEVNGE
jgi:hypothetical protein